MTADTIDHTTLSRLVEAGAVCAAHVVGQAGGWAVTVKYGTAERSLAAQRSRQIRVFKRMEKLVSYLKEVGNSRFDVDAAEYTPEGGRDHSRPDRAEALRRTYEAAAHDKWFREQVGEAIREADDTATVWVSNDDAKKGWAKKRAEMVERKAAGGKA
jgi:hypothetical protein